MEKETLPDLFEDASFKHLLFNVESLIEKSRGSLVRSINTIMVETYWHIGEYIVQFEQSGTGKAEYGKQVIVSLARRLTEKYGKGYSRSNVFNFRLFYLRYPKIQTLSGFLTWSHYIELIKCDDDLERSFYAKQSEIEHWSSRELKRQRNSMLYERLAISTDKEGVLKLASEGRTLQKPEDLLIDPYVLDFTGLADKPLYVEDDLQKSLVENMKTFLLELGRGFAFIASQYHIPLGDRHFHCDLVFYHAILKCYVLIDLKRGEIQHEDIGQMNLYLNYFKHEVCQTDDNQPIGIVLGASKNDIVMEYALEGISNQLFAAKYQLYLPKKEELQSRLNMILATEEKKKNEY